MVDPIKYGPFTGGVNNVDRAASMAREELLSAVNLDITRNGTLVRRSGFTKVIDAEFAHSLWVRDEQTAFYSDGVDLKIVTADAAGNLAASVLAAGSTSPVNHLSFVEVNGDVYLSDGQFTGRITASNGYRAWGVETPPVVPALAAVTGGLTPGRYRVALAYVNDLGEESGLSQTAAIELGSPAAISCGLPSSSDPTIAFVRVYLSPANDESLYRYDDYPVGDTVAVLTSSSTQGAKATRDRLQPFPPADLLCAYNGRIYGAKGKIVWFTEPLQYGLYNPRRNFMMFPRNVGVMLPVTDGIYFGDDQRMYFYAGPSPGAFTPRIVTAYGAVPGTGMTFPSANDPVVGWMSERGFRHGASGGTVSAPEKERIMVGMFERGASLYRERDGIGQVITTLQRPRKQGLVCRDSVEAEVRRVNREF